LVEAAKLSYILGKSEGYQANQAAVRNYGSKEPFLPEQQLYLAEDRKHLAEMKAAGSNFKMGLGF
jgi:hypothetical protein